MSKAGLPGLKDFLELPFRTIRIGTLRTFPLKDEKNVTEPMIISDKDGSDKIRFKLSAKHIHCIHAFLSRGCPVIWIKPSKEWAEKTRKICGMINRKGPYLDPQSKAVEEHELAIITAQDPLPFESAITIKNIFKIMAEKRKLKFDKFFTPIENKENNLKLVQCVAYMERLAPLASNKSKKLAKQEESFSESDESDGFSEDAANNDVTDDHARKDEDTDPGLPQAQPTRKSGRRAKKKSYAESPERELKKKRLDNGTPANQAKKRGRKSRK